jgi:predicted ester cyclase
VSIFTYVRQGSGLALQIKKARKNTLLRSPDPHFLAQDLPAIDVFFAPNALAHLPGSPKPTNREGFKQFVSLLYTAFPDLHHTVEDQIAENDKVVNRVTAWRTHRGYFQGIAPTSRLITIADIFITRIKEGKVIELWAQFDALGLLQQLGVFSPIGQDER